MEPATATAAGNTDGNVIHGAAVVGMSGDDASTTGPTVPRPLVVGVVRVRNGWMRGE